MDWLPIVSYGGNLAQAVWATWYKARQDRKLAHEKTLADQANQQADEANQRADRSDKRALEAEDTIRSTQAQLLKRIGYEFASSYCRINFLDAEGTCRITRGWEGLKATSVTLPRHDSRVRFSTAGSRILEFPSMRPTQFEKPLNFTVTPSGGETNNCVASLEIIGGLTRDNEPLSYEYTYTVSHAFLMSEEEIRQTYGANFIKNEYFFLAGDPTFSISIEVEFPREWRTVHPNWGVKLSDADVLHEAEYERIKNDHKRISEGRYRFTVDNPLQACAYFVHWWPPPKTAAAK
jgi:hypothetical protein